MSSLGSRGTALITGASSGIGAVYADRLARRGYDLILVARNKNKLEELAYQLSSQTGRDVETISADLTNPTDITHLERIIHNHIGLTLLVNNAGVGATRPLRDSKIDAMTDMITLNITAVTRLTHAAVPGLVKRGHGTIINISSIAAIAPELLNGVYGGSKAFVLAFSQSLHHELASQGVQVQAVLPGATATDFWEFAGLPLADLTQNVPVMSSDDMVDAALAGLDQGELVTLPALPNVADWQAFESARQALMPNLSHTCPAARYQLQAIA